MQTTTVQLGGERFSFGPLAEVDTDTITATYPNPVEASWHLMHVACSRAEAGLTFDDFMERWRRAAERGADPSELVRAVGRADSRG